ncbi:hypothetical protein [uncultured Marivirga sp.]|uniref:hypothetical protein n=1 Tax=uncultured Marivirga sp. TaxID=1123707 RepID=UPI0030EE42F2
MSLFKNEKGELRTGRILWIAIFSVLAVWAITFVVLFFAEDPGQIGDSFGMVNALFTALAFVLLIYTSLLQTQELRLQREELRENRKQLESSAKAHNELVSLTKVINRDKLIPQLEIINFEKSDTHIYFDLKVLFGEIYFQEIKISDDYSIADNNGSSANNDHYLEDDNIGSFEIKLEKLSPDIQIYYKHVQGSKYYHKVYDISSIWRLSEPIHIYEDQFRMI